MKTEYVHCTYIMHRVETVMASKRMSEQAYLLEKSNRDEKTWLVLPAGEERGSDQDLLVS